MRLLRLFRRRPQSLDNLREQFAHGDRSQLPLDARARLADDELGVWGAGKPGRARPILGDD